MELYSPLRKLCGMHRCGPLDGDYLITRKALISSVY